MRTFLKVLSVLLIIGGILGIFLGLIGAISGGAVTGSVLSGLSEADAGYGVAAVGLFSLFAGAILILSGVFTLLTGIFGFKGAKGNQGKLKVAVVMNWITLALAIIGAISAFSVTQDIASSLITILMPILFAIAANGVKKADAADSAFINDSSAQNQI